MHNAKVLDIETYGKPWDGTLLCLGWDGTVYRGDRVPMSVWAELADPDQPIISHFKYDAWWLLLSGHQVTGPYYDTMSMAHLLNENQPSLKLDYLVKRYLGVDPDKRIKQIAKVPHFVTDAGDLVLMEGFAEDSASPEMWHQLIEYNHRDIKYTARLYDHLRQLLHDTGWEDYWLEEVVPMTEILTDMEAAGIPINLEDAETLRKKLVVDVDAADHELREALGYRINFNSDDQLAEMLFSKVWYQTETIPHGLDLRKPTLIAECAVVHFKKKKDVSEDEIAGCKGAFVGKVTPSGFVVQKVTHKNLIGYWVRKGMGLAPTPQGEDEKHPTTSSPALLTQHGGNDFVVKLVRYRKLHKVISTYLDTYADHSHNGRLYPRYNQTGTVTWRLSSAGPNIQNQPSRGPLGKEIRKLFQGNLIIGDHSQLEPRLMAHFSGDPVLLDIFRNDRDIYLITAGGIFGGDIQKDDPERAICKELILSMGYGAGAQTVARRLCLAGFPTTTATAKGYLKEIKGLYSGYFEWKEQVVASAEARGWVKTLSGRMRRLKSSFEDQNWKNQGSADRKAVNSTIQGSAADVLYRNMQHTRPEPDIKLLSQIHDELIWQHKPWGHDFDWELLKRLKDTSENPGFDLRVPLRFDVGYCQSWADKGKEVV